MAIWDKAKSWAPTIATTALGGPGLGLTVGAAQSLWKGKGKIKDAFGATKDWLLGEDPDNIQTPDELTTAQEGRRKLSEQIMAGLSGPNDAAQQAAMKAGQQANDRIVANANSLASGARGLGAIAAMREAQKQSGLNLARAAGENAQARAQAVGQDQANLRAQQQLAGDSLSALEQGKLTEEEYKKGKARPGALSSILGAAGAGLGAWKGGEAGAKAGAGIGNALGGSFERR